MTIMGKSFRRRSKYLKQFRYAILRHAHLRRGYYSPGPFLPHRTGTSILISSWKPVKRGIPQGSILGPILFVIYINDMPEVVQNICELFADDAKLFRNVHLRDEDSNKAMQIDIDTLVAWSKRWQLPFNVGKCKKCLHIGQSNPCAMTALEPRIQFSPVSNA